MLDRCVPTNLEYQWHQQQTGLVPEDNRGGLYRRVFLSPFHLGGWSEESWLNHFETDKQWHGAPMASFRRAFAILGSVRDHIVDKSIRDQLYRLRDLYLNDEGIISVALRKQYTLPKRPHSTPGRIHPAARKDNGRIHLTLTIWMISRTGNSRQARSLSNLLVSLLEKHLLRLSKQWTLYHSLRYALNGWAD